MLDDVLVAVGDSHHPELLECVGTFRQHEVVGERVHCVETHVRPMGHDLTPVLTTG